MSDGHVQEWHLQWVSRCRYLPTSVAFTMYHYSSTFPRARPSGRAAPDQGPRGRLLSLPL